MSTNTRQTLISCHVIVASFFLPVAVMFIVTGGLYTVAIKGSYENTTYIESLVVAPELSLNDLVIKSENILKENGLKRPTGDPSLKKVGTSWLFEWTGAEFDFTLEPTSEEGKHKVTIKKTSIYRYFVQLHKAKGGWAFKIFAVTFALGLLFIFISGVSMASSNPSLRATMRISLIFGTISFILLAYFS